MDDDLDTRWVYLGRDGMGVALEVVAIQLDDGSLLVIHAMQARSRYGRRLEEAERCQV